MQWRYATLDDVERLADLNRELIAGEGHHNPMGPDELRQRMRAWLESEYRAVLFEREAAVVAYALFRTDEWSRIHLRHFLVVEAARRQGVGREAMQIFQQQVAAPRPVILEVLVKNEVARRFYAACGFHEYAVTLLSGP